MARSMHLRCRQEEPRSYQPKKKCEASGGLDPSTFTTSTLTRRFPLREQAEAEGPRSTGRPQVVARKTPAARERRCARQTSPGDSNALLEIGDLGQRRKVVMPAASARAVSCDDRLRTHQTLSRRAPFEACPQDQCTALCLAKPIEMEGRESHGRDLLREGRDDPPVLRSEHPELLRRAYQHIAGLETVCLPRADGASP